jgi:hypothetical protein
MLYVCCDGKPTLVFGAGYGVAFLLPPVFAEPQRSAGGVADSGLPTNLAK